MKTDPKRYCQFVKRSGYWKGHRCCNKALVNEDYCGTHLGMVLAEQRKQERS